MVSSAFVGEASSVVGVVELVVAMSVRLPSVRPPGSSVGSVGVVGFVGEVSSGSVGMVSQKIFPTYFSCNFFLSSLDLAAQTFSARAKGSTSVGTVVSKIRITNEKSASIFLDSK